jgi:hypothetical protein
MICALIVFHGPGGIIIALIGAGATILAALLPGIFRGLAALLAGIFRGKDDKRSDDRDARHLRANE